MKLPILRPAHKAAAIIIACLAPVWFVAVLRADEPADAPAEESPASEVSATDAAPAEATGRDESPKTDTPTLDWPVGLQRARQRAQTDGKPLLVRAGAPWCPWCDKLLGQIETPTIQEELKHWTLVYVDIDESPDEARRLSVGPIPALRVVNAAGKVVASQDGYLDQDELLTWLKASVGRAALDRPDVLLPEKELEAGDIDTLLKLLQSSDPLAREAALRRLMPQPKMAAAPVVEAFAGGKLATRLLTLELLAHWQAPVESLDPWRPETVTPDRICALRSWTEQQATAENPPPVAALSDEQLRSATDAMDRLVEADDAETSARLEQLARYGAPLRPLVIERLQAAASDRAREQLLLLRYRLAASDALVLTWTGGLAQLASSDVDVRHQAAAQLVERATAADEPLLLELFADADPLVREISLRGLRSVGTDASSSALVKLLDDPEPNVRAAVLKQLAESPDPALSARISAYLKTETDPDLVVHGIRALKAAVAPANLIELLHHPSWQVRAEAAEALGGLATPHQPNPATANIYAALIEVLADEDPFVISRAVHGLRSSNLVAAVEPLAKAAQEHPEIAADVIEVLAQGNLRSKADGILRGYLDHKDPRLRAQVITTLAEADAHDVGDLIERGLKDPATEVRTATAGKLLQLCNQLGLGSTRSSHRRTVHVVRQSSGLLSAIGSLFFGTEAAVKVVAEPARQADEPEAPTDEDSQKDEGPPADDPTLLAFREGKGRPEWTNRAIEPLEAMLTAESAAEKEAAALALIPLGHDEPALAVLRGLVESKKAALDTSGQALPWLLWDQRINYFDYLLSHKTNESQLHAIAEQMIARDPERGVAQLWKLLEADDQSTATAFAAGRAIMQAYPDPAENNSTVGGGANRMDQKKLDELSRYATEGKAWQRNIALVRLIEASADNAAELAQRLYERTDLAEAFRRDALQLLLIAADRKEAEKIVVGEIAAKDPGIRNLALLYLAGGNEAIGSLRNELPINRTNFIIQSSGRQGINLDPPDGVTAEMLKPLLADPDDEVAAAAGYLTALSGSSEGLPTLVRVWRGHQKSDNWTQALYRAIAALDDDQYTPLLVEINKQLPNHNKSQFYWTIRSMHGPEVLKLRKQIREEVGMENLR